MKVLLNENNYFTGNYVKVGNISGGIEVYSLPDDYDDDKKMFCKPENYVEEKLNKIPIYGIVKEYSNMHKLPIEYIKNSQISEEMTEEEIEKLGGRYVPVCYTESGEKIEISKEDIILVAVNPSTNEVVENVNINNNMMVPIIRYDEKIEYINKTKWIFDKEAYNAYLEDLETNPPVQELTDREKIAALEKENKELKENIEVQKEINNNQDLMLLELLEQI